MAAEQDEICRKVIELLAPFNKNNIEITGETKLSEDLEMDSMAAMNLVMEIEDTFDIDIPINLLSEVTCPRHLAEIVSKQLEG